MLSEYETGLLGGVDAVLGRLHGCRPAYRALAPRKIGFPRAVANADIATGTQDTMTFPCDCGRVVQVMIDHRHEDQIRATIRKRHGLGRSLPEADLSGRGLLPGARDKDGVAQREHAI